MIRLTMALLFFSSLLSSCNIVSLVGRKQDKKFEKNGFRLHSFKEKGYKRSAYYIDNGKPKIMLLHGYGASGISQYYRTALNLSKDYDVILPDLLYCGRSHGDSSEFSYTIPAQVKHIEYLVEKLNIQEPILLVGNSYGGIVASYFAEKNPQRVSKLVVFVSPINCYSVSYADSLAKSMGVLSVKELLSPTNVYENRKSLDIVFHKQPYIPNFLRHQMVKYGSMVTRDNQVKLLDYLISKEEQMNKHYFKWQIPVHLAWGEFDQLIPMSTCEQLAERYAIPNTRIKIFKNAAHAANVEFPIEFSNYIRSLMKE
jgi:pimeloyl-ACP methyl ester carboxylesterase